MQNNKLHYLPYGKILAEQLKIGNKPRNDIFLFLGKDAWKRAKQFYFSGQTVHILPENKIPEQYIWPVYSFPVLVFDMNMEDENEAILKRLALQLLKSGASCVRIINPYNNRPMVVFGQDREVK